MKKVKLLKSLAMSLTIVAAGTSAMAQSGEKIAVFTKNQTNPFFQVVRLGADNAAKQMGAVTTHYIPTKADSIPEQLSLIDDVIIKKPNAIVFTPVDYKAMVAGVQKINAAGIPVVNVTDRAESGKFVSFVGSSDYELGLVTGRYLLKALGGKGSVVILEGVKGSLVSADRVRGFNDALKEFPQVKLLASQPGNFQRLQGLQVMENLMQTYPQIDGVMAANDSMGTGAIEALEGANRKSQVVGINGTKEAVDSIKEGKMLASGDYNGYLQGCVAAYVAIRELRKLPVPKEVVFKAGVVDKNNYQSSDIPADKRTCPKWEDAIKGL
jgi:ribose transport system substrate-binding protein